MEKKLSHDEEEMLRAAVVSLPIKQMIGLMWWSLFFKHKLEHFENSVLNGMLARFAYTDAFYHKKRRK